jgi:predicted nuclease of predicted toxin-antitoxin system
MNEEIRFKLDENLGERIKIFMQGKGYDVELVVDENAGGSTDEYIFDLCIREGRSLITLDLDFSNVLRFPPEKTSGIIVLRLPQSSSIETVEMFMEKLFHYLGKDTIKGTLLIIESTRIRIYTPDN